MDEKKILDAVNHFKFVASPSSGNSSDLATVKDINNLIKATSELVINIANAVKK